MASPMPPYNRFLASPAPTATPWQGEATFEGGLVCTYYMADLETVTRKKASFLEAGTRDVIIISDFDRTITKSFFIHPDGTKSVGQTAYSLLSDSKIMSEACKKKMKAYHAKYYPLEFDPNISHEQKYKYMDEWWMASNQALLDEKPSLATLFEAVAYAQIQLRPGFAAAVQEAYRYDIPVVVFSAGITQVIEEVMRQKGPTSLMLPNVHVIANDLELDENNIVTAFKEPLMHSLNKKDTSIKLVKELTRDWFVPLRSRKHILLMGDNLGDAEMSDGYEGDEDVVILKVGFLNSNEEAYLPQYRKAFDIVVLHDGPMVPVAAFIKEIIGDKPPSHDYQVVPEQSGHPHF